MMGAKHYFLDDVFYIRAFTDTTVSSSLENFFFFSCLRRNTSIMQSYHLTTIYTSFFFSYYYLVRFPPSTLKTKDTYIRDTKRSMSATKYHSVKSRLGNKGKKEDI